jgi:hypothetical protein
MKNRNFFLLIVGAFLSATFINFTTTNEPSVESREQRLSRFIAFLEQRKSELHHQGAIKSAEDGPAGLYQRASLLDPRLVKIQTDYAINRYDSYIERVRAQIRSENLKLQKVEFGYSHRPIGFKSPEDFDPKAGDRTYDSTWALNKALAAGNVWLSSGKIYTLRKTLYIPSHRIMMSDGSGQIFIKTGADSDFNLDDSQSPYDPHLEKDRNLQPLRITSSSNIILKDFRIVCAAESNDTQVSFRGGLQISNSLNIEVSGLEMLGFPRTLGIFRIKSSQNVKLFDNLVHGSFTTLATRQVTGIEVDNDLINSVFSKNVEISGNLIFGIMLSRDVFADPYFRSSNGQDPKALGYETDGINISGKNPNPISILNNSIMDVGEGIDIFGSNSTIQGNHIERAFGFGIKVIHAAQNNLFSGNKIFATGFASIIVSFSSSPYEETGQNIFIKNRIRFSGAFDVFNLGIPIPLSLVAGVRLDEYTKKNSFYLNEISEPMFTESPLYQGAFFCNWPSRELTTKANKNTLWKNNLVGFQNQHLYSSVNADCFSINSKPPVFVTTEYHLWTPDGVRVEKDQRYDSFNEQISTDRVFSESFGTHDVRKEVSLGDKWQGRDYTYSIRVRRGTNDQIMVRDQLADWYVIFKLQQSGSIEAQTGSMVRSATITSLSTDWYLLKVNFFATQPTALLTLRQLAMAPGLFLDLGESRLDH